MRMSRYPVGGGGDKRSDNDHDNMRLAFEQFMLQSGNPTKHKKKNQQVNEVEQKKEIKQKDQEKKQIELNNIRQEMKKAERKYWSIFHKFCNILQSQWMDIDDQTLQVAQSISGIRQRLPITMKLLNRYQDNITRVQQTSHNNFSEWKNHAYNQILISPQLQSTKKNLQKEDVELALSHDLLQHEKMMQGLRNLFANLSEMHEALSRTLDEMMKFHLIQQEEQRYNYFVHQRNDFCLLESSIKSYFESTSLVDLITDLFHLLSLELYRKQTMVQLIIKSADDRLLLPIHEQTMYSQFDNDNCDDAGDDLNGGPKKIVDLCVKKWPISCNESFIDNSILEHVLALHEKNH